MEPALLLSTDRRLRRGVPLRTVSAWLSEQGVSVSKDALFRHQTRCLAPPDVTEPDLPAAGGSGVLVALAARDTLASHPRQAQQLAERLHDDGFRTEAEIVASPLGPAVTGALKEVRGTDAGLVLAVRLLASALSVVMPRHPQACLEVAQELERREAPGLAADFQWLADKESSTPSTDPGAVDVRPLPPGLNQQEI